MADIGETHENGGVVSSGHVASAGVMDDVQLSVKVTEDISANCKCTLCRNFSSVFRQEIASRDVLLQKLEESVTRMAEELSSLKECSKTKMQQEIHRDVESLQAETSSEGSPQEAQLETEEQEKIIVRNRCIEALMSATEILENNEEKTSQVKGWFEKIYDTAPETSYILRILEKHHSMTIFIDCNYAHIGRLITRVVSHNGNKVHGTELPAFTDLMACKMYVAGKPKQWDNGDRYVYSDPIAVLAECLTQFAMSVIFKNKGSPYTCDDKLMEEVYERIVSQALSEQSGLKNLSYSFQEAHRMQSQIGKEVMLISAIPAYLVEYGLGGVMSHVQLYFHYLFFKQHVVPKMMDYLRE